MRMKEVLPKSALTLGFLLGLVLTSREVCAQGGPFQYYAVTPCRVADTRATSGFPAGYGPPSIAGGGTQRSFTITGQCGIPAGAQAVSFNFAVWGPVTRGGLRVFPAGLATPTVSTLNWEANILALANAAVVPLGSGGAITVEVDGAGTVDIFVDINGYYSSSPASSNNTFVVNGGASNGADFTTTGGGEAVIASCLTPGNDCYAFYASAATGDFTGVFSGGRGFFSSASDSGYPGVLGQSPLVGVTGNSTGTGAGAFGVTGFDGTGNPSSGGFCCVPTGGLFYTTTGFGVWGNSQYISIAGYLYNSSGSIIAEGFLGSTFGTAADSTTGPWAVFAEGNFGASGAKHFVEPHPTDAKKVIMYSSLEGREVGTYFRGTASIVNGTALITVPEDFRIVTADEGLTVQVTPIGGFSQVYIVSQDLNEIVIRGSRDVQFHYMVNGVRRAFQNFQPVQTGYEFMPQSPSDRMPLYLTEEAKARLISNGTYNPDGTVNMTTAERAGFTKIWADREAAAKAAAESNAKAMEAHQPRK